MQRVSYEKFGAPEDVLRVVERDTPAPGPGQVRVRLKLAPIHNHDLMTIRGLYGTKPSLPAYAGTEALGVVDALGEGAALSIGQRVAMSGLRDAWSETFLVDAKRAVPLPDSIDDDTGCQLLAMPLSALLLLRDLDVKPGEWIVQNTANGLVGKLIARFAAEEGVHVVHLVRRDAAVAELAAEGIQNAVSTETPGFAERVKAVTGGAPIVRGIDSVGGDATNDVAGLLANHATLFSFGSMSRTPVMLSSDNLLFKALVVKGFWATLRVAEAQPGEVAALVGRLVQSAAKGTWKLKVDARFPLAQAGAACAASDEPGRRGKVVLTP